MLAVKPEKCENCPLLEACSKSGEKKWEKRKTFRSFKKHHLHLRTKVGFGGCKRGWPP